MQDLLRRSRSETQIVGQFVEESLDADGCLERAQLSQFRCCETETIYASHKARKSQKQAEARTYFTLSELCEPLQPYRMPGYKTARRTIGRLPGGRPTTGIIIVWRRIESQSGNNRESMALPCIDSDPFATAASTVFPEFG